jgi:peptide/nickel transport system permease protein
MVMAFFRSSYLDLSGVIFCIILMSISTMFYIIGGQYLVGKLLKLVPISGYDHGFNSIKFISLPILVAVISGIGAGSRWYRTLFLEEMNKDYVKTARSKGLSEMRVLFRHILKNAMLPILTGIVVIIPSLFMGSLVLESFFGVPGLGSYIIDAIGQQDFAIVRAMVFLGSVLYIIGLILTDISYTLVDPRVRLK